MKYRKKPVVVEAIQYDGTNGDDCIALQVGTTQAIWERTWRPAPYLGVETLNGIVKVPVGEWIIKGVRGEVYPCRADIFEQTYEEVDDDMG